MIFIRQIFCFLSLVLVACLVHSGHAHKQETIDIEAEALQTSLSIYDQNKLAVHATLEEGDQVASTKPHDMNVVRKIQNLPVDSLDDKVVSRQPPGLTGFRCTQSSQCVGARLCLDVGGSNVQLCRGGNDCICLPADADDLRCSCADIRCLPGDVCSNVDGTTACLVDPNPFPVIRCGGGRTGERCRTNSQCRGPRVCRTVVNGNLLPCGPSSSRCACFPTSSSNLLCSCANRRCLAGDVCSVLASGATACISTRLGFPRIRCA